MIANPSPFRLLGERYAVTYRDAADTVHVAGYIFIGVIVVFLLLVVGGKKLLERLERRHLAAESESSIGSDGTTMGD